MTSPTADVSVRVAWADDAEGIAAVQVRAWRTAYDGLLPADVLASLDPAEIAAAWHASLSTPKDARNRVLVALERNTIRGFALTSPGLGPRHRPDQRRRGVRPDRGPGTDRAGPRLPADAGLRGHPARGPVHPRPALGRRHRRRAAPVRHRAGWAPDGAHRELDLHGDGAVTVKQVRLTQTCRNDTFLRLTRLEFTENGNHLPVLDV